MSDIVERLRSKATDCHVSEAPLWLEAANEIEWLQRESDSYLKGARAANGRLHAIAKAMEGYETIPE